MGSVAFADGTVPPAFTIESAVHTAIERNPTVQNDRDKINEEDATIKFAWAQVFPTISGIGTYNELKNAVNTGSGAFNGTAFNDYDAELKLSQPLYQAGAISSGIASVQKERQARQYDLEVAERDLTTQVLSAFYGVLVNQRNLEILHDTEGVLKQYVATTKHYLTIGRAQLLDSLQAQTQLALIYPQIANAENSMKAQGSQLAQLLHLSDMSQIQVNGKMAALDRAQVNEMLKKRKPELPESSASALRIGETQDTHVVLMSSYYPSAQFLANIGRNSNAFSDIFNDDSTNWSFGVQFTIPIFSGLSSVHERSVLAAQLNQAEDTRATLVDQLNFNAVSAETSLNESEVALETSQKAAELGKASLKEGQRDYKLQTISALQFLTVQQTYLTSEQSYMTAKYNYLLALGTFFVAKGIPISILIDLLEHNPAPEDS